jgi:hypothetical protein
VRRRVPRRREGVRGLWATGSVAGLTMVVMITIARVGREGFHMYNTVPSF